MLFSRRTSTALIACALLTASAQRIAAQAPPAQQEAPPPQPGNPAIEDWKPDKLVNVEILPKTMAPDEVIALMKTYNASLNVDCVFCHKGQVGKPWSTYDFTDTSNLIEVYIGRIRRKLDERGAPPLIQTVRGAGYRLRAPDS